MAKGRMISSDTFEDDWFGSLSLFDRVVWIGLITACADDQGRILNNPNIIRSRIFPYEDIKIEDINNSIERFFVHERIYIYTATDDYKSLIQIINWWEYQSPSWAAPSKYQAPEGWIDRIKIHISGNKVHTENWENKGGFVSTALPTPLPTPLPTLLHKPIKEGEVKSEGEEEGKVRTNGGGIFTLYENSIGIVPGNLVEELKQAEQDFSCEWLTEAFKIASARNKRSWGYVRGILRRFTAEGFIPDGVSPDHPPNFILYNGDWVDPRNVPTEET